MIIRESIGMSILIGLLTNKFEQRFRMPLLCAVAPPIAAVSVVSP
jgi:hypothetical protein